MGGAVFNVAACITDFSLAMTPAGSKASWSAWVAPAEKSEILADFEDFGPGVRGILECVEGANKWSVHDMGASYPKALGHNDGNDEPMPVEGQ